MKNKTNSPGRRLADALTKEQLETLLDTVGSKTLLEKIKTIGDHNDDIAATVKKVLSRKKTGGKKGAHSDDRQVSDGKIVEQWNDAWGRWYDIVDEVGDEAGRYAIQEHQWESPYFDGSALSSDLEKVATDMEPMIDRVYDLVDEENLFTEALEEIDKAIKTYPEWMGEDYGDGCVLEYHASNCVLKWLWRSSENMNRPGAILFDKIEEIGSAAELVCFDRNATIETIAGLPEPVCREIYKELSNGRFREEQEKVYSPWNALMLDFKRRYDKDGYLAQCGRDLGQNWLLGQPLVEKEIAAGNWLEAQLWLIKTFASFRRVQEKTIWFPETALLNDGVWREEYDMADSIKLLQLWQKVSDKIGNRDRAIAARFQVSVAQYPDAPQRVIEEFKKLRGGEEFGSLGMLFRKWQDETAERSLHFYRDTRRNSDTWIHWLIDAQIEGIAAKEQFQKRLEAWLLDLLKDGNKFRSQLPMLSCLTADLAKKTQQQRFAGIFSTALAQYRQRSAFDKTRSALVRSLCRAGTIDTIFDIWRERFSVLVPDPSSSGGVYLQPVAWAKVLYGLNPAAYTALIRTWGKNHRRRRNLWSALRGAKLPIGE